MSWAEVYPWASPGRGTPVVRQIYDQARDAIATGALKAGARLPSSRDLAGRLGVARASVVSAYEQLLAEGYAEGRRGAGTFVAADLTGVSGPGPTPAPASDVAPPALPDAARALAERPQLTTLPGEAPFNTGRTLLDERAI